jgi:hypothetical protein
MNYFECEIYIFGESRTIYITTKHTLEELKNDWGLREELIGKALLGEMIVQNHIEQF